MLRISRQKAQTGKLVNGSVLEQAQLRVCDTTLRNDFYIHLNPLAGIGHLFVGLWLVRAFLLFTGKQPQFPHDPEQAFRTTGVTTLSQTVPQLHHAQRGIAAAHISDQLQFCLSVLVWVTMRTSGLTGQGLHTSVPATLPEVDIRPAFVIFPTGTADAVFRRVFH